jgi:hypothetical protein
MYYVAITYKYALPTIIEKFSKLENAKQFVEALSNEHHDKEYAILEIKESVKHAVKE